MLTFRGQGAAQALEDAVILSQLLSKISEKTQIPAVTATFESLRKPRLLAMQRLSHDIKKVYSYLDGPQQEERDKQLRTPELDQNPIPWLDPKFQQWMYSYDAVKEAETAWAKYSIRNTMASAHITESK